MVILPSLVFFMPSAWQFFCVDVFDKFPYLIYIVVFLLLPPVVKFLVLKWMYLQDSYVCDLNIFVVVFTDMKSL